MKSIVLILPYFGKWPIWFEAHLVSIAKNPSVNWLMVTDCPIPEQYPTNITFVKTSLAELNSQVNQIVEADVPLTPRKFCDLKPAYGDIFEQYITEYDFWGFCDMDIIWGDIRKFITNDILDNYDIISSRKEAISGHFNLFRNTTQLNNLYKQVPNYKQLFSLKKGVFFDEHHFSKYIQNNTANLLFNKIFWSSTLLNQEKGRDSHQEYYLDRWLWDNGKMINTKTNEEVMYLHFINWKRTLKNSQVTYNSAPNKFYASYSEFHYEPHSNLKHTLNSFKNIFFGYYIRMAKKRYKKKLKKKFKYIYKFN